MRVAQAGIGKRRHVVVLLFCSASLGEHLFAMGEAPFVLDEPAARAPGLTRKVLEAYAKSYGFEIASVTLVGYSAGNHGVCALLETIRPDAVVSCDGPHIRDDATMPRAPWQSLFDRARADGEGAPLVVVSHTYIDYTDTLRDDPKTPQIERAYQSTATACRALTGWPLPEPVGHWTQARHSEGRLTVYSYESGPYDQAAHRAQLNHVLPMMLATHMRPIFDGVDTSGPLHVLKAAVEMAAEEIRRAWLSAQFGGPPPTRGARLVAWLAVEEANAPREIPGVKHEPRIVAYGKDCRRGGRVIGILAGCVQWSEDAQLVAGATDEEAWCAKLVSAGLCATASPLERWPVFPRVSCRELVEDARAAGTWREPATYVPEPGDLAIYKRAGGDPTKGGSGHVRAVVGAWRDGEGAIFYSAIGGNEKDTIGAHAKLAVTGDAELCGFVAISSLDASRSSVAS